MLKSWGRVGRVCLGNLLISGRKTLILSKAKGGRNRGIRLEGFKEKEKVMSRVQILALFALIKD